MTYVCEDGRLVKSFSMELPDGASCVFVVDRSVGRYYQSGLCGVKAKGVVGEQPACGKHLRMLADRARRQKEEISRAQRKEDLEAAAKELSCEFGITIQPHFDWQRGEYTDEFVISRHDLLRIIEGQA